MRSFITTLSIVLAIAFLCYTGLTNHLARNLAQELTRLEGTPHVPGAEMAAATAAFEAFDPADLMSLQDQRGLARALRFDRVGSLEYDVRKIEDQRRSLALRLKEAQERFAVLEKDATATAEEVEAAQRSMTGLEESSRDADRRIEDLGARIALGNWIAEGVDDPAHAEALARQLRQHKDALLGQLSTSGGVDVDDVHLGHLVDVAEGHVAPAHVATMQARLEQLRITRRASDLRTKMRRNGLDIEAALTGNPLDTWLIIMALLTCAVGIANAMLMSVTERIREIGTMKCLGAQDNLVIKLFLLESALLGVVGGGVGLLLGILVALGTGALQFGSFGFSQFPVLGGWGVLLLSIGCGLVLSTVAAVYPAYAASRMQPVDALRVDE